VTVQVIPVCEARLLQSFLLVTVLVEIENMKKPLEMKF